MKNCLFTLVLCVFPCILYSQNIFFEVPNCNVINYRKLNFNDYQKEKKYPDTTFLHYYYRYYDSFSYILNSYTFKKSDFENPAAGSCVDVTALYQLNNDTLHFLVFASFYPDSSYMVIKTNDILAHEQIHFDICELYARKLKSELYKLQNRYITNLLVDNLIKSIKNEVAKQHIKFDMEFEKDQEKNGNSYVVTKKWNQIIASQMELFKDYSIQQAKVGIAKAKVKKRK